jgi:hypothetical protein
MRSCPNNFHLLISEPEKASPSVVIQVLKLGIARQRISAHKRREKRKMAQEGALVKGRATALLAGTLL